MNLRKLLRVVIEIAEVLPACTSLCRMLTALAKLPSRLQPLFELNYTSTFSCMVSPKKGGREPGIDSHVISCTTLFHYL